MRAYTLAGREKEVQQLTDTMLERRETFRRVTHTNKSLLTTMVTSMGVARNMYWDNVQTEIESEDLFEKE